MNETDEFYLPEELLITCILTRLPVKSLLRFKSVNKRFHFIISSSCFAKLQLKNSTCTKNNSHLLFNHKRHFLSFDFESFGGENNWDCSPFNDEGDILTNKSGLARVIDGKFEVPHSHIFVIGSCDGLVCLRTKSSFLYIWNPTTLACRKIRLLEPYEKQDVVWGFGCVTSGRDYKIVRICQNPNDDNKIIKVFSLLENCWASSQEKMDGIGKKPRLYGQGVSVNDVTYWLYTAFREDIELRCWIIGFDLDTRKLNKVPLPEGSSSGFGHPPLIYVMDGRLCACWKINHNHVIEVGTLMEEGSTSSWVKLYQLSDDIVVNYMYYGFQGMSNITTKNMFAVRHGQNLDTILFIDPAQESHEDVHKLIIPRSRNVVNYTESLISPFLKQINCLEKSEIQL